MFSVVATILFLIATIVLSIVSVPVALLDRSGSAYLWLGRLWAKIFLFLFRAKLSVTGIPHLKKGSNYVFCVNHTSYTDIPVLLAAISHDIRLILRRTLTRIPIWGWALLASPLIIIDRSNPAKAKKSLDEAANTVRNGASVLLFPEGTRTRDGMLQPFKRGAFRLAYESGAEIIPVGLKGTFAFLPRSARLPKTGMSIEVYIGEPIQVNMEIASDRERELDLMKRTEDALRGLLA